MESSIEYIIEAIGFVMLIAGFVTLWVKLTKEVVEFKTSTEKDIQQLKNEHQKDKLENEKKFGEVKQLYTELLDKYTEIWANIEMAESRRNDDYKTIMEKVNKIEVDFVKHNAKQTQELTKMIVHNFEELNKKIDLR